MRTSNSRPTVTSPRPGQEIVAPVGSWNHDQAPLRYRHGFRALSHTTYGTLAGRYRRKWRRLPGAGAPSPSLVLAASCHCTALNASRCRQVWIIGSLSAKPQYRHENLGSRA